MSVRLRLTLWYSSVLALTLLLFGIGLYFFLHFYVYHDVEQQLKSNAEKTFSRIQPKLSLTLKGLVLDLELQDRDLYSTSTFLQLYNVKLNTISRSANLDYYDVKLPITPSILETCKQQQTFFTRDVLFGQQLMIYHMSIFTEDENGVNQLVGVLQTAVPINQYETFFATLKYFLLILGFMTIVLAASLGWFLARKALQPIEKVIDAANQIQKGDDLDKRIAYQGSRDDEVSRLSYTINQMLERIQVIYNELEMAYRAQRRFVSDASHELRTPLTTIRGNIEWIDKITQTTAPQTHFTDQAHQGMITEALRDISAEAKRMSTLVNDLLTLARADSRVSLDKTNLALQPVLEEVVRKARFLPHRVEWLHGDLDRVQNIQVYGNADYLQQLFFIFIENAFKYTHQGYVRLDTIVRETQIGVRIEDTGIGMDEAEVPHIFERFYRADASRGQSSGTGLGLSIAKWIIDEHQGSIEVLSRKGQGTTFIIWFPTNYHLT